MSILLHFVCRYLDGLVEDQITLLVELVVTNRYIDTNNTFLWIVGLDTTKKRFLEGVRMALQRWLVRPSLPVSLKINLISRYHYPTISRNRFLEACPNSSALKIDFQRRHKVQRPPEIILHNLQSGQKQQKENPIITSHAIFMSAALWGQSIASLSLRLIGH